MEGWLDVLKLLATIAVIFGLIIFAQKWTCTKKGIGLD